MARLKPTGNRNSSLDGLAVVVACLQKPGHPMSACAQGYERRQKTSAENDFDIDLRLFAGFRLSRLLSLPAEA